MKPFMIRAMCLVFAGAVAQGCSHLVFVERDQSSVGNVPDVPSLFWGVPSLNSPGGLYAYQLTDGTQNTMISEAARTDRNRKGTVEVAICNMLESPIFLNTANDSISTTRVEIMVDNGKRISRGIRVSAMGWSPKSSSSDRYVLLPSRKSKTGIGGRYVFVHAVDSVESPGNKITSVVAHIDISLELYVLNGHTGVTNTKMGKTVPTRVQLHDGS